MAQKEQRSKAIFLDRDGTINVEVHYLHEPEKFEFVPRVPDALLNLQQAGYKLIIITNQGAIGKGYYGHEEVAKTHDHMLTLLSQAGIKIDGIYYCPHAAVENCECRKPKTGMLEQAIKEHNIDPAKSWMIGDKRSDLEAGHRVGTKTALVLTGYGKDELTHIKSEKDNENKLSYPDIVAENLMDAAITIFNSCKPPFYITEDIFWKISNEDSDFELLDGMLYFR